MRRVRRPRDQLGAAAVEFALVLPLLLTLVLAVIEFGYMFFSEASVAGAAREGARNYAIHWKDAGAVATAQGVATAATPIPGNVVSVAITACSAGAQTDVVVTYRYRSLTGWLDGIIGASPTLTGRGTMRCGG